MDKHGKLIFDENRLADSELGEPELEQEEEENTHHPEFNADATLDADSSDGDGLKTPPSFTSDQWFKLI